MRVGSLDQLDDGMGQPGQRILISTEKELKSTKEIFLVHVVISKYVTN